MNIRNYLHSFKETVQRFPIEVGLSLIFFGISQYQIIYIAILEQNRELYDGGIADKVPYYSELSDVLIWSFVCLAISYSLNIIFSKSQRIFYYLSILSPIMLAFIFTAFIPYYKFDFEPFSITMICSLLLIYASKNLTDNRAFTVNAIKLTTNLIAGSILALIAFGVIFSIIYSVCHILDVDTPSILKEILSYICLFILFPIFFLTLELKAESEEPKIGKSKDILFNYILTPSIVIYGAILYIYFAKIAILWRLPEGVISTTAIIFIAGGIFVSACRTVLQKRILDWVFDYFTYISIPAVVLFWISAIYRISEYGLTGSRVYLLLTLVTLTLWMVAILSKRFGRFQYLTVFVIITYMIFTFTPGITYQAFDERAEAREALVDRPESFSVSMSKDDDLDIVGYKTMKAGLLGDEIKNDTLFISDSKDKIIAKISCDKIIDYVFANAEVTDYITLDIDALKENKRLCPVYRNDEVMLVFRSMRLERSEGDMTIGYYYLDYVLMK